MINVWKIEIDAHFLLKPTMFVDAVCRSSLLIATVCQFAPSVPYVPGKEQLGHCGFISLKQMATA